MQAVVLAGGRGQRLGKLTEDIPKPILPIGGKPLLEWLINNISRFGFDEIIVLAGYKGEKIKSFLETRRTPENVKCIIEPEPPLGTAGALKNIENILEPQFFVFNGDTVFDFNYLDLMVRTPHMALGALALRFVEEASRHGSVILNGDIVENFLEKAVSGKALVNGGVYFLKKDLLDFVPKIGSLEKDVFPLLPKGSLRAFTYKGFFIDIGIPEDFFRAQNQIPKNFEKPAVFFDRDGTLNLDKGHVFKIEDFEWLPGAKEIIKFLNDSGYLVIVVSNQAGIAKGFYSEEDVHKLHNWMNQDLHKIGGHVDAFYFCPHHPTEGLGQYRKDCDCRKPKPGLIFRAAKEWGIKLDESIGIGDKESDLLAFKNAGLKYFGKTFEDILNFIKNKKISEGI